MSSKEVDTTISRGARKKAGVCVPSRYMQAAQGPKFSSLGNASVVTSNSLPLKNQTVIDVGQAPQSQQDDISDKRITSTPNSTVGELNIPLQDVSGIAHNTACSAPVFKDHLVVPSTVKQRPKFHSDQHSIWSSQPAVPVIPASKTGKEKAVRMKVCSPDHVKEIEIRNLHAMHIQAAFLESRALKSLQVRSQNALEQFYKVYCVIQLLMQRVKSAESDLIVVSHLQLLQQLLKPQEEILEVVSKEMPTLLEHYYEVSAAIDSVRSNLPLSDVNVSSDSNLKADLACLLAKCETELENFFKCHSSEMIESAHLSKLLLEIKNSIGDLEKETCRLNDLLVAVDGLAITESSLKIGEIMSVTANNIRI